MIKSIQPIGKGQYRIKTRRQSAFDRLDALPGVTVDRSSGRVCFYREQLRQVLMIVTPEIYHRRRRNDLS